MNAGMLWQENAPVVERVQHAAAYFQKKYGRKPDTAFVNPKLLTDHQLVVEGVEVLSLRIPVTLLWIGVEDAAEGIERKSEELVEQVESEQSLEQMEMAL